MKNRWLQMSLSLLFGGVLFLSSPVASPAFATSCQIAVNGQQTGSVTISHGGAVTVNISAAEIDGEFVNAPDNAAFYINIPETWKRYYIPANRVNNGNITITLANDSSGNPLFNPDQSHTIQLIRDWGPISPHTTVCTSSVSVVTGAEETDEETIENFNYCQQVPGGIDDANSQRAKCMSCVEKGEPGQYVYTAVGCIRTEQSGLTEDFVRVFMGMVGGVALVSIISAAFLFTTSQGDTNKVKQAKELITAAVSGLFFIVLSIFILQFIGVNILGIPGLG